MQFASSLLLAIAVFGADAPAPSAPDPEPSPPPGWRRVVGQLEPHRIPLAVAWEAAFRTAVTVAAGEEGLQSDQRIVALSKYSMYINPAEVRQVLAVAGRTLQRVEDIRCRSTKNMRLAGAWAGRASNGYRR
jgi:hypothetical protein